MKKIKCMAKTNGDRRLKMESGLAVELLRIPSVLLDRFAV